MGSVERAGDATSEVESGDEEVIGGGELAQQLMKSGFTRNEVLAALTNRIQAETLASLPPNVRRRVRALRNLQKEFVDIEAKFYREVHVLECKYEKMYKPLYEKRAQIVNGQYEPTDEECQNPWRDDAEEEDLARAVQNAAIAEGDDKTKEGDETKPAEPAMDSNVKGIPDFWYTIFRNVSMLSEMMQEYDEPILKNLQDIKVNIKDDPFGFVLEFHFAPNEYFTNTILTKEYSMKCKPDEENPLEFEGPEIFACKGCEINWNKGKNVTVKTIKKKQKHKSRGSVRVVTKSVQADSFFNFFSPPVVPEEPDADIQALLTADFEIGHYIRERVISRAVLIYTGEGLDDDDDDEYEEEEEEECSTDDSEEDEPAPRRREKKAGTNQEDTPAECKQQ